MARQSRPHDRFMVQYKIGGSQKLASLPAGQRWVYVAGVLALAAQSPIRGALLLSDATFIDHRAIARAASVTPALATRALKSFRDLGMLERDKEFGFEIVHDFKVDNPDPPASSTEGERLRKREQRARALLRKHTAEGAR